MIVKNESKRVAYTIFIGNKAVTIAPGKAKEITGLKPAEAKQVQGQVMKLKELKFLDDRTKEAKKKTMGSGVGGKKTPKKETKEEK